MKKITLLFALSFSFLCNGAFAQKADTIQIKKELVFTKISNSAKFATAHLSIPLSNGAFAIETVNNNKTTLFQAIAKTDSIGIGDHLFRFFGPNGPVFSVNAITPQNGSLITRFGTNYTVNGVDGLTDYAYNAKKYATYIELDSDNGAISLNTEEGALSSTTAPARNISLTTKGLCVKRGGIVQVNKKLGIGLSIDPSASLEVNSATAGVSGIKLTQLTSSSTAAAANAKPSV